MLYIIDLNAIFRVIHYLKSPFNITEYFDLTDMYMQKDVANVIDFTVWW